MADYEKNNTAVAEENTGNPVVDVLKVAVPIAVGAIAIGGGVYYYHKKKNDSLCADTLEGFEDDEIEDEIVPDEIVEEAIEMPQPEPEATTEEVPEVAPIPESEPQEPEPNCFEVFSSTEPKTEEDIPHETNSEPNCFEVFGTPNEESNTEEQCMSIEDVREMLMQDTTDVFDVLRENIMTRYYSPDTIHNASEAFRIACQHYRYIYTGTQYQTDYATRLKWYYDRFADSLIALFKVDQDFGNEAQFPESFLFSEYDSVMGDLEMMLKMQLNTIDSDTGEPGYAKYIYLAQEIFAEIVLRRATGDPHYADGHAITKAAYRLHNAVCSTVVRCDRTGIHCQFDNFPLFVVWLPIRAYINLGPDAAAHMTHREVVTDVACEPADEGNKVELINKEDLDALEIAARRIEDELNFNSVDAAGRAYNQYKMHIQPYMVGWKLGWLQDNTLDFYNYLRDLEERMTNTLNEIEEKVKSGEIKPEELAEPVTDKNAGKPFKYVHDAIDIVEEHIGREEYGEALELIANGDDGKFKGLNHMSRGELGRIQKGDKALFERMQELFTKLKEWKEDAYE